MQVSEARLEANRRNAQRSTGPKTAEGKLASRANAWKHGMTGTGVVLPEEDRAEVARRSEALRAELGPAGPLGQILVDRLARLSVRMERCASHESAALATRVRHAVEDFDDARALGVEEAFAALDAEPGRSVRRLGRTPGGVDRLLGAWLGLLADLDRRGGPTWDDSRATLVDRLMGRGRDEVSPSRAFAWSRAVGGDPSLLGSSEGAPDRPEDARAWAVARLLELIRGQVADLEARRELIDAVAIELDRAGSPARALFDTSPDAARARQYEAAAERHFYRALGELRRLREPGPPTPSTPPARPAPEPARPLASFSEGPPAPMPRPTPPLVPAPPGPPVAPQSRAELAAELDFAIGRQERPGPRRPRLPR